MQGTFARLTHGLNGLELMYMSIFVPMLTALIRGKAPLTDLLLSPLVALPVILLAGIVALILSPLIDSFGFEETIPGALTYIALYAATGYAAGHLLARKRGRRSSLHLRGAIVLAAKLISARYKNEPRGMTLAGVPVAPEDETKHFKLIGTTGTGKSTAIKEMLTVALARGDRVQGFRCDDPELADFGNGFALRGDAPEIPAFAELGFELRRGRRAFLCGHSQALGLGLSELAV